VQPASPREDAGDGANLARRRGLGRRRLCGDARGCWVGFGQVLVPGYRTLRPCQEVEYEAAEQGGYGYRAVRAWPAGGEPVDTPADPPSAAYTSTLTLTFDDSPSTPGPSGRPPRCDGMVTPS
jgi:CspA family cold shock protein